MNTPELFLDFHERSHRTLKKLLDHCRQFSVDEINREMHGFGYPSIRLQLFHIIGTEKYWIGVVLGRLLDDEDRLYPTIATLEEFRRQVSGVTTAYLKSSSNDELSTPRRVTTNPGKERNLIPASIIMRVLTHSFHHQGQVVAICRLLGRSVDGIYLPIL